MPPAQVTGVALSVADYRALTLTWNQPAFGTGTFLRYEFRVGTGTWTDTGSASPIVTIFGLQPDTGYTVSIRAVNTVGNGPGSTASVFTTRALATPTAPLFPRARSETPGTMDLSFEPPLNDGGDTVTHYEFRIMFPNSEFGAWHTTGDTETTHRVAGLVIGQRYGFRVRAVNSVGPGAVSEEVFGIPARTEATTLSDGTTLPLVDTDRQRFIVQLGGRDCRIEVWWQPDTDDEAWYATLEVPTNTVVVQGQRLATNTGLLTRHPGILPGDIVCRATSVQDDARDPDRDAWENNTHALKWEPA